MLAAHLTSENDNPYKLNVVYVADVDLISDWFFVMRNLGELNLHFDNVPFVLNAVDVLAGDRTFLDLRQRRTQLLRRPPSSSKRPSTSKSESPPRRRQTKKPSRN